MMSPSPKHHWMVDVLQYSGPPRANFAAGTPAVEVWATARLASGLSSEELTRKVAAHFKLAVADLKAADRRIAKLVPEKIARRYGVFPLQQDDRNLVIATSEPTNLEAEQAIAFSSARRTVFQLAAPKAIQEAIDQGYASTPSLSYPSLDEVAGKYVLSVEGLSLESQRAPASISPANPLQVPRLAAQDSEPAPRQDSQYILIVDDDSVSRRLAMSILTKHGYKVTEAKDGLAAMESILQGTRPALIVLDLEMPRLDGREVLARLKGSGATSRIPVVVLTGSDEEKTEAELIEEGADDYIRKPLEPARFTARIKAALRRANA